MSAPGGLATSAPLMGRSEEPTIFEMSVDGRSAAYISHHGLARVVGRGAGPS